MNRKTMAKRFGLELSSLVLWMSGSVWAMDEAEFKAALAAAEPGGTVVVPNDITFKTLPIAFTKPVTVKCADERFVLKRGVWSYEMIAISAGAEVRFENVIFDGIGTGQSRFTTMNGAALVLGAGTTLRNFNSNGNPGGLYLKGSSHLVMEEGSEISGFLGSNYGTAVLVENTSVFDMEGGIIHGCQGSSSNGWGYDGTVLVQNGSPTFNMSGGVITGNTSVNATAGVMVWSGTMNLSGTATITNNVGGLVNDLAMQNSTGDEYPGKTIAHRLNVASDWTGFTTLYTDYAPYSQGYLNWMQFAFVEPAGKVPGLGGRIRNQNYPQYVANAYRSDDRYFYWMEFNYAVDGVPVGSLAEAKMVAAANRQVPHTLGFMFGRNLSPSEVADFALENWCPDLTLTSLSEQPVTLNYYTDATIFTLNNANQRLRLENITLHGYASETTGRANALVEVKSGRFELGPGAVLENGGAGVFLSGYDAVATMEDGAVIRNCHRSSSWGYASALLVGYYASPSFDAERSPVFNMTGGVISNCLCDTTYGPSQGYGGAVYVQRATFNMTGGRIVDNNGSSGVGGVTVWENSGGTRFSGDARVENNVGGGEDVYVAKDSYNVSIFGDFRGRVGVSNGNQTEGEFARVRKEPGATGANCFVPVGKGKGSGLIGTTDPNDATRIVWRQPVSRLNDVWFGSQTDFAECLPKVIDLSDAEQMAKLPYVCGGQLGGSVQVKCSQSDIDAGTALFDFSAEGRVGKIAFELPPEFAGRYTVRNVDSRYCLAEKLGLTIVIQ